MTRRYHKKRQPPELTVRTYLRCAPNSAHPKEVLWLSWCQLGNGAEPLHSFCQHPSCDGRGQRVPTSELTNKYRQARFEAGEIALALPDGQWLVQPAKSVARV